jgi:hypothetical protein
MAPGLVLTALYALFGDALVELLFSSAYAPPGALLPLVGMATTLYAGVNIWLSYSLSASRPRYVFVLTGVVILQVLAISLFHNTLQDIVVVLVVTGLAGNAAGALTLVLGR